MLKRIVNNKNVETKNDADCACNIIKVTKSNPLYEEEHDPHREDRGKAANTSELAYLKIRAISQAKAQIRLAEKA